MSPEIFASLEALATRTHEGSLRRVNAFVESHGRCVLEALATNAAFAGILVGVAIQRVFFKVHFELEATTTLATLVWPLAAAGVVVGVVVVVCVVDAGVCLGVVDVCVCKFVIVVVGHVYVVVSSVCDVGRRGERESGGRKRGGKKRNGR